MALSIHASPDAAVAAAYKQAAAELNICAACIRTNHS